MKTSTRLILLLTIVVSAVMTTASYFMHRQRAIDLEAAARDEVRAHAFTLQIALEECFRFGREAEARYLISRLHDNAKVYGVFLFDGQGNLTTASNDAVPEEMRDVKEARHTIATGETIEVARTLNQEEVISIIMPLRLNSERVGAFEIAQPISFVQAEISQASRDSLIKTVLLCLTIFLVVGLVTHFSLTKPVRELLGGAVAVGRGDLNYRVIVPRSGGEFSVLAREFNRMADSLEEQRRKAAQEAEERLALARRLRHSERLATVGRLAAGVAHEMGAPLQVIDGRARQLQSEAGELPATRQRNLTIIRNQADRITRIVRQLLNLSRPYNLKLRSVDVPHLLAEVAEAIETSAAQHEVSVALTPVEPLRIEADPDLLHEVLVNICQNAVHAMTSNNHKGGRLGIDCHNNIEREGRPFIAISISDTGGGIATEHLDKIFDPFFTTKEIGQGTGLGLAVSSRIVEEHGGWIEAANKVAPNDAESGGATFTIYLPVRAATIQNNARKEKEELMNL